MFKSCFAVSLFAVLFIAHPCFADGCFIGKGKIGPTANQIAVSRDADITEPNQNAFIAFKDGKEHLIIQVKYRGKLSEFLWLVPTPSKPTVKRFKNALFEELHEITAPPVKYWFDSEQKVRSYSYGRPGMMGGMPSARGGMPLAVNVIKRERIGIYDTVILKSTSASDLRTWLNDNGYPIPNSSVPVLADYLKRGWVFIAMRVNLQTANSGWKGKEEGLLEPLHFTFAAKKPIYPLKISSLNPGRSEVLLYVTANSNVKSKLLQTEGTYEGFRANSLLDTNKNGDVVTDPPTKYAYMKARINGKLTIIRESEYRISEMTGFALTKLRGTFKSSEMTEDIVLEASHKSVPPTPVSPPLLDNIGMLFLLILLTINSIPGLLFIPGILAGIYLKIDNPVKRLRLIAMATLYGTCVFLPVIVLQEFLGIKYQQYILALFGLSSVDYDFDTASAASQLLVYVLIWIGIISPTILTAICFRIEKSKQIVALVIYGCIYAMCIAAYLANGFQWTLISQILELKSYSIFGIIAIGFVALLCILTFLIIFNKRRSSAATQ